MSDTASPVRGRTDPVWVNYRLRIVGSTLFVVLLLSISGWNFRSLQGVVALFWLAWPHLAYGLARWRGGDARAETTNLVIESFFGGALIVAFEARLWPGTAIYFVGIINFLLWGGARFLAWSMARSVVGFLAMWLAFGLDPHWDSEPMVTGLSIALIIGYSVVVGSTAFRLRRRQREMRAVLEREERQANELLLNVFPRVVIPRLKAGENPIADQFADVTVVFADIVGFTPLAERLGPKRTVLLLNDLFQRFDRVARELRVEKIETTGDGYLAVAGAPEALDDHAEAVAALALAMQAAAQEVRIGQSERVRIRVGAHTGPIFAGVIGESRFHYKIFGETVNTASRIQVQCAPDQILVSEATFKRIGSTFRLEEHGVLDLKGHGPMRTYALLAKI